MLKIGSEITALTNTSFTSGIQRTAVETHRHLDDMLGEDIDFSGVVIDPNFKSDIYRSNSYLKSDVLLKRPILSLEESKIDLLIQIDGGTNSHSPKLFRYRRENNLKVISLIYDLIPISHPQYFPEFPGRNFYKIYIQSLLRVSDVLLFTSRDVLDRFNELNWHYNGRKEVIHLGRHHEGVAFPKPIANEFDLLYVSTIEPRKGHQLLLKAFDLLLNEGIDSTLTLVGRSGWNNSDIVEEILNHQEFGGRLKWIQACDEAKLRKIYSSTSISIAPSEVEGFGLNIEEALSQNHKVAARDIAVFRERPNVNIRYFKPIAQELAICIKALAGQKYSPSNLNSIRSIRDFSADMASIIRETTSKGYA